MVSMKKFVRHLFSRAVGDRWLFAAKSSSIHVLNGDKPLSRREQRAYRWFNRLNNAIPAVRRPTGLSVRPFSCDVDRVWPMMQLGPGASPGRKLSHLFWASLPWARFCDELGPIRMLDVGCGSGNYSNRFMTWGAGR